MKIKALLISLLLTLTFSPIYAEVPMTNPDGTINCEHPDNKITTTCGGAPAPPAVAPGVTNGVTPPMVTLPKGGEEPVLPAGPANEPMTNPDGSINCKNPSNAITTTCWAQGASNSSTPSASASSSGVDCAKSEFKEFPVCTGIKPEVVVQAEEAAKTAALSPEAPKGVDCVNPENLSKPECLNTSPELIKTECELEANRNLPKCQPMTKADGSINCAQPANAITTTCWALIAKANKEQVAAIASELGIDCDKEVYKEYPICTRKVPEAVLVEAKTAKNPSLIEELNLADLATKFSAKTKSTQISLDLETVELPVTIKATKKGGKTITLKGVTDANGNVSFVTKNNLKGYTLTVLSGGLELLKKKIG